MIFKNIDKHTQIIFLTICFLLFVPSFYSNFWGIAEIDVDQRPFAARDATGDIYEIEGYDPYPNMLIMGRLAESKKKWSIFTCWLAGY